MTEIIDTLVQDAEDMFPPRRGGMVESARAQAAGQAAPAGDEETPAIGYPAVRTQTESPERFSARTVLVSASPSQLILPQDANRRRATIVALDAPVVLAASRVQADDSRNGITAAGLSAGGFVLPVGVPLSLEARGELWAAPTAALLALTPPTGRVSVVSELYTPAVRG